MSKNWSKDGCIMEFWLKLESSWKFVGSNLFYIKMKSWDIIIVQKYKAEKVKAT